MHITDTRRPHSLKAVLDITGVKQEHHGHKTIVDIKHRKNITESMSWFIIIEAIVDTTYSTDNKAIMDIECIPIMNAISDVI